MVFTIKMDPNIREETSPIFGFRRFVSGGAPGHRIWAVGAEIGTKTVKVSVNVPIESKTGVSIEMNGSYGWSASVMPGKGTKTFTSTSTGLSTMPGRTIAPTEQPDRPFARVDGADLNFWFTGGVVDIQIVEALPLPRVGVPPEIEKAIEKLLPQSVPGLAKGVVEAPGRGWYRALYYDPLTNTPVSFLEPPTIVAIAEVREGTPPKVTAPTITIPTVELPKASPISIPTITLPTATEIKVPAVALPTTPTIEIPLPSIDTNPLYKLVGYRFTCGWAIKFMCDALNPMMELWDSALYKLIDAVNTINDGFKKARNAVVAVRDSLFDFRDKTQTALNEYKDKIQVAVNDGLSDSRTKTQEAINALTSGIQTSVNDGFVDSQTKIQAAFNAYRDKIEASVNAGLTAVIPKLWEMMGMPIGQLISPINIRNVTTSSFEFYSLSTELKLHYIAIGRRST